ncbi:hypothetical protein IDH44_12130 [Paenibacillus sp. IB182496]|uniref:Uncharacterized protein n=1 Tax=Paenibacillus sabuli TaxID=2772509 RepID=A0A927GRW8_9BACL|nr:hypothetical protein [Paenibacillus sabuli]MBD2845943.1 hypothetical protein [Paenibacillus sabuli]
MHLRSDHDLATREGDRVYHELNTDSAASAYPIQRLGRERTAGNVIIDQAYTEPRIGWSAAAQAPDYAYGSLVVLYPEVRNSTFFQPWYSQHGTYEDVWFPVSQENGRWNKTAALQQLRFFPQGDNNGTGENYLAGSRIGLYLNNALGVREVIGPEGASSVTLQVPAGAAGLRVLVTARTNADRLEDELLVEANGDADDSHYAVRRATALDSTHETSATAGRAFGLLPGGHGSAIGVWVRRIGPAAACRDGSAQAHPVRCRRFRRPDRNLRRGVAEYRSRDTAHLQAQVRHALRAGHGVRIAYRPRAC